MNDIELIKAEIERMHQEAVLAACGNDTDWLRSRIATCVDILTFIDSLPEENLSYVTDSPGDPGHPGEPGISDLEQAAENIYKVPFGTRAEDFIAGAEWQKEQDEDWLNEELIKAHLNGVMTGDRIAREESQMPMPEDTVIFMKGVAEGRRLEREDNNKALAEMYGYEGGTESPLVKITFTIPKEHFNRLMPIKQGDVFGIENLTNKEGRK